MSMVYVCTNSSLSSCFGRRILNPFSSKFAMSRALIPGYGSPPKGKKEKAISKVRPVWFLIIMTFLSCKTKLWRFLLMEQIDWRFLYGGNSCFLSIKMSRGLLNKTPWIISEYLFPTSQILEGIILQAASFLWAFSPKVKISYKTIP